MPVLLYSTKKELDEPQLYVTFIYETYLHKTESRARRHRLTFDHEHLHSAEARDDEQASHNETTGFQVY